MAIKLIATQEELVNEYCQEAGEFYTINKIAHYFETPLGKFKRIENSIQANHKTRIGTPKRPEPFLDSRHIAAYVIDLRFIDGKPDFYFAKWWKPNTQLTSEEETITQDEKDIISEILAF